MLGKILKYDLRWIFQQALFLYPILLGDALLIACLPNDSYSDFVIFLRSFAEVLFPTVMAVIFVTTIRITWTRMVRSMYGDEAYLTRTLPVSVGTIFSAKILAGIIFFLVNVVFCLTMATLAYPDAWNMVAEFADMIHMPILLVVLIAFIAFFLQSLFAMMAGFLGITIGYRFRNQHFAWSAVFTAVIYLSGAALLVGIEFLIGVLFNGNLLSFFTPYTDNDPIRALQDFFFIAMTVYAIYNVGGYIAGRLIQKRGTDID